MHKQFFISDTHFGHSNILKFTDKEGKLIRGAIFSSIEEHDNTIIENINRKVRIQDKLYILGDVIFNKKLLSILDRINTKKKILIKGNHDLFQLKDYLSYFKDIRSYKTIPEEGIIFSHIPIHVGELQGRWKINCHGHLHQNVLEDKRYINLCAEHTNYAPVEFEEIKEKIKNIL